MSSLFGTATAHEESVTILPALSLREMQRRAFQTSVDKGFHESDVPANDKNVTFAHRLLLVVGEIVEALEEIRDGRKPDEVYISYDLKLASGKLKHLSREQVEEITGATPEELGMVGKPEGFPVELADALIRILDVAGTYDIDIEKHVLTKMRFNGGREARHGREF